jgi:hypothetical protein
MKCWECDQVGDIHQHHPVPQSRGGTKTIPLCLLCHAKAHHRERAMGTPALTREALAAKRARGEATGGDAPFGTRKEAGRLVRDEAEQAIIAAARECRATGLSLRQIAARLEERGLMARGKSTWTAGAVSRLLACAAGAEFATGD